MQILRKLAPLLPPFTRLPGPPGGQLFLGGFWHLVMSNPSHLAQKISQNHQFWSNRCMTPSVAALCMGSPRVTVMSVGKLSADAISLCSEMQQT